MEELNKTIKVLDNNIETFREVREFIKKLWKEKETAKQALADIKKRRPTVEEIVKIILKPHEIVKGMTQGLTLKETDPIVLAIANALLKEWEEG